MSERNCVGDSLVCSITPTSRAVALFDAGVDLDPGPTVSLVITGGAAVNRPDTRRHSVSTVMRSVMRL